MSYNPQFAKLGEILVNEKIIDEKQLDRALAEQKKKKGKLGNILVSNGTITENDLVKAFSLQLGSKSISEDELLKAPEDIVKLLAEDFAKENNVITLKKTSNSIYVAMEDPEDVATIDDLVNADTGGSGNMGVYQPNLETCRGGSDNVMGLVSGANIIVANTRENGAFNGCPSGNCQNPGNSHGVRINAHMIALNESFVAHYGQNSANAIPTNPGWFGNTYDPYFTLPAPEDEFDRNTYLPPWADGRGIQKANDFGINNPSTTSDRRGTILLWGGVCQRYRGYVQRNPASQYGNTLWVGYQIKDYNYDDNLLCGGPPAYPTVQCKGRNEVSVRIRIDGVLIRIMTPPVSSLNGIVTRVKILSKLNIAEHRLPQDGRMKIKTVSRDIDVRVSILPTVHGEKVVLRLLGSGKLSLNLTTLGFPENKLTTFKKWINQPYGMVIISGPTGSGKSTTLYAALKEIHSEGINITTVEDPVEYQLAGINQVQMHEEIGLTFATSLRSILRQDPDVLLIGEIRDEETANIAVKFSMTGHLVFSTVHANDATSTILRLLDLGIPKTGRVHLYSFLRL